MQKISDNGKTIAIVFRKDETEAKGTNFLTADDSPLQLGSLIREAGEIIVPHRHKLEKREILHTHEILIIIKGKVKVDLFNDLNRKVETVLLGSGDIILLESGGHGLEMMEDSKIIEVKQGPYTGTHNKEYF